MAAPMKKCTLQENLKISTFDIAENEEKVKWITDLNYMTHSVSMTIFICPPTHLACLGPFTQT
jgi:hypothetical protein